MLLLSPSLAQTLGLEEALLLQLLFDMQQLQTAPALVFQESQRSALLPFWSQTQFTLLLGRLQAQGVITTTGREPWIITIDFPDSQQVPVQTKRARTPAPLSTQNHVTADTNQEPFVEPTSKPVSKLVLEPQPQAEAVPVYSMNETRRRNQEDDDLAYLKPEASVKKGIRSRKTKMHSDWEPSSEFPKLLTFHDIPLAFALSELGKFRQYYLATDRLEISWDVRLLNWVQRSWHDSLNSKGQHDKQHKTAGEPADASRSKRTQVREALRNIEDTNW